MKLSLIFAGSSGLIAGKPAPTGFVVARDRILGHRGSGLARDRTEGPIQAALEMSLGKR